MTVWDYPNTQVVRADGSAPWDEGTGGEPGTSSVEAEAEETDLSSLTKAQLLEEADAQGVDADESMTKAQIIEAIEAG